MNIKYECVYMSMGGAISCYAFGFGILIIQLNAFAFTDKKKHNFYFFYKINLKSIYIGIIITLKIQ